MRPRKWVTAEKKKPRLILGIFQHYEKEIIRQKRQRGSNQWHRSVGCLRWGTCVMEERVICLVMLLNSVRCGSRLCLRQWVAEEHSVISWRYRGATRASLCYISSEVSQWEVIFFLQSPLKAIVKSAEILELRCDEVRHNGIEDVRKRL